MLDTKQVSTNLRGQKLYHAFFPNHNDMKLELQEEKLQRHKQVENKQHATKKPMGQWRNQNENQKIPQEK